MSDSAAICGHGRKRNVCPDCAAALQGAKVKYLTDKDIEDAAYEVRLSVLSRCVSVCLCVSVCVAVCLCVSQCLTAYSMLTLSRPLAPLSPPLIGVGRPLREPRVSAALCRC